MRRWSTVLEKLTGLPEERVACRRGTALPCGPCSGLAPGDCASSSQISKPGLGSKPTGFLVIKTGKGREGLSL